jgi:hypothetical protein
MPKKNRSEFTPLLNKGSSQHLESATEEEPDLPKAPPRVSDFSEKIVEEITKANKKGMFGVREAVSEKLDTLKKEIQNLTSKFIPFNPANEKQFSDALVVCLLKFKKQLYIAESQRLNSDRGALNNINNSILGKLINKSVNIVNAKTDVNDITSPKFSQDIENYNKILRDGPKSKGPHPPKPQKYSM